MSHTPDLKNLITCSSCYRSLPEAFFGRSVYRKAGYQAHCSKCHNERNSHYNCRRIGWTPKIHTGDLIYNVKRHNTSILQEATTIDMEILGYGIKDKCLYRIKIYKGLYMNRVFQIYRGEALHWGMELTLNEAGIDMLIKLLRMDYVRLERSDVDLINSKTLIHDLGN